MNSTDSLAPTSRQLLLDATAATKCRLVERVQSLWSGYGQILRLEVLGGRLAAPLSVIMKEVRPPGGRKGEGGAHPRGWSSSLSHRRKLRSYAAEMHFYANQQLYAGEQCRVPAALGLKEDRDGWCFVFEDLDAAGFAQRRSSLSAEQCRPVLHWLARFHARHLTDRSLSVPAQTGAPAPPSAGERNADGNGLWERGTYWHLATRPDELEVLSHSALRRHAAALDKRLAEARYFSIVHGDAKLANFCFTDDLGQVAAVDFQYVGGGVGVQDLAYFLSSCMGERQLQRHADQLVDLYFQELKRALTEGQSLRGGQLSSERPSQRVGQSLGRGSPTPAAGAQSSPRIDPTAVEEEWRSLYPIAWADFMRFLLGWAPGHTKVHGYSLALVEQALGS